MAIENSIEDKTATTPSPGRQYPPTGPPPPEGHAEVGPWVNETFMIAKKDKDRLKWDEKWYRNHELVRGKHFRTQQAGARSRDNRGKYPRVMINLFHVAWTVTVANLTDNKPKFDIVPHDEAAKSSQPVMNGAASDWWRRTRQQQTLSETVQQNEKYGTTLEKMIFATELEGGRGDIACIVVDNYRFFPWPGILDIQNMPQFYEIDVVSLREIQHKWPETGAKVKPEQAVTKLLGKDRDEVRAGSLAGGRRSNNLPNNYAEGEGYSYKDARIDNALVIECWCRDYTMEDDEKIQEQTFLDPATGIETPVLDAGGEPILERVKTGRKVPKYPGFIRLIHVTNSGKVVLDDMPNPSINPTIAPEDAQNTYLWDRYPYQKATSYSDGTNFWGYSIVEQIEVLVLEINKKISKISAYIDKTAYPTLVNPKNSGIESHKISNLPGMQIRPATHTMVPFIKYLDMPPLPSDFYKYIEMLLRLIDVITGIHEVTEGRKPAGISSGVAIAQLQEKAQTIFRDKIRNLDLLIEERGRMWVSLAQNWYTEKRKVTMSGKNAQDLGEFVDFEGADFQGEFSFEVVAGSTMPKSVFVRNEQAVALATQGFLDQRAVLEALEWPQIEEVILRMQQGPLGQLLERLEKTELFAETTLQAIQKVGAMDDNTFKQAFKKIPTPLGGATASQ